MKIFTSLSIASLFSFTLFSIGAFAQTDNTIYGTGAGVSITTGDYNTIIGDSAGTSLSTGGGNTFVLVKGLHQNGQMAALRAKLFSGTPYLGTSAGTNICGVNMQTTNDMPIVYPPSFKTLGSSPEVFWKRSKNLLGAHKGI